MNTAPTRPHRLPGTVASRSSPPSRARALVRAIRRDHCMTILLVGDILLEAAGRIRMLGGTITSPRPDTAPNHEPFERSNSKRRAGPGSPVLHVFGSE